MAATGAAPDQAIKNIAKAFETSKTNAGRVVMTESAFFASAAQKDCFNELGVERYEIVGTYDSHMCDFCGDMNGKVFPMKDFKEGVTAPPFHPWCRCCTAPYFDDMEGIGERWMRDPETGKGDYVPPEMTFKEWKDIYVNKTSTLDDWEKSHYGRNVWSEYNRKKKPGFGSIEFEEGYNIKTHKSEIEFSQWIHDNLGGDITLLVDDNKPDKVNTADYIWNGKLWELKTASTEKSVKSSLKKGLKQISKNPGGIMINFGSNDFSVDVLKYFIEDRLHWYVKQNVDIMVVGNGKMMYVFRYKK